MLGGLQYDREHPVKSQRHKNMHIEHKIQREMKLIKIEDKNTLNWHYYRKSENLNVRQHTICTHDTFRTKQTARHYKYWQELMHTSTGNPGMAHRSERNFSLDTCIIKKTHPKKHILSFDDFRD